MNQGVFMNSVSRIILYTKIDELDRLLGDAFVINGVSAVKVLRSKSIEACTKAASGNGLNFIVLSDELSLFELNSALEILTAEKTANANPIMIVGKKKDPKIYSLVVEYGVSEYYTGETTKKPIRAAVSRFVEDTPLNSNLGKHFQDIAKHLADNNLEEATKLYEKILRNSDSISQKIRLNLAELYFQMDRFDRAKKILSPIKGSSRKNPKYYYLMARIAVKQEGIAEAAEYFEMCQFLNPNNIVTLINIGAQYLNAGDNQSAKMVFEDVLSVDADCKQAQLGLGVCKLSDGDIDGGIRLLGNSINEREKCSYFNTAAICLVKNEDYKRALDLYIISLKYAGSDNILVSSLCYNIGLLYIKNKKVKQAIDFFQKALEYSPFNVHARHNLSVLIGNPDMSFDEKDSGEVSSKHISFDQECLDQFIEAI